MLSKGVLYTMCFLELVAKGCKWSTGWACGDPPPAPPRPSRFNLSRPEVAEVTEVARYVAQLVHRAHMLRFPSLMSEAVHCADISRVAVCPTGWELLGVEDKVKRELQTGYHLCF